LIHQDRGELAAFASTRAVAEEEAAPVDLAFGMRLKLNALLGYIAARQILRCCVERMDQVSSWAVLSTGLNHLPRKLGNDAGPAVRPRPWRRIPPIE
jgi:hypothetical protein